MDVNEEPGFDQAEEEFELPPKSPLRTAADPFWGDACEPTISRRRRLGFRIFGCTEGRLRHTGNPTDRPAYYLVRGMVRDELCLAGTVSSKPTVHPPGLQAG